MSMSIATNKTLRKCEKKIKEIDELKQKDVNILNHEETESVGDYAEEVTPEAIAPVL